jgi:hypothetical protein
MRIVFALVLPLALAACGPPLVTQATPAFIEVGGRWTIKSNELVDIAQAHCAQHGRNARQRAVREESFGGLDGRLVSYDCVP